jgi:hypothetical protein
VIDRYRTGYHPPSDVEYDEFGSKTSLTSKNDPQKGGTGRRLTFFTKLRGQKVLVLIAVETSHLIIDVVFSVAVELNLWRFVICPFWTISLGLPVLVGVNIK